MSHLTTVTASNLHIMPVPDSNEPITGTIVLTCLLYIPYIMVSLILWTLSPVEWLMRLVRLDSDVAVN
jgi:hypothetical protein